MSANKRKTFPPPVLNTINEKASIHCSTFFKNMGSASWHIGIRVSTALPAIT
jgi:hypothetical protein